MWSISLCLYIYIYIYIYIYTHTHTHRICILIVMCVLFCIFYFHRVSLHSSPNLAEVFPYFFLSCKANARVYNSQRRGTPLTLPNFVVNFVVLLLIVLFLLNVLFYLLFVCKWVLYYCHRVSTQLQLTNVSYHIYIYIYVYIYIYTLYIHTGITNRLNKPLIAVSNNVKHNTLLQVN